MALFQHTVQAASIHWGCLPVCKYTDIRQYRVKEMGFL